MDHNDRLRIVAGADIFVAVFLLIVGILVIIFGIDYLNNNPSTPQLMLNVLPWIITMLGISCLIYSIKRIIDDILNVKVRKPNYPPPRQVPSQRPVQNNPVQTNQSNPPNNFNQFR